MGLRTGLIYATVDGQTLKICNELKAVFKKENRELELYSIDEFNEDISSFDKLVIGSSIRYGVHNENIIKFSLPSICMFFVQK